MIKENPLWSGMYLWLQEILFRVNTKNTHDFPLDASVAHCSSSVSNYYFLTIYFDGTNKLVKLQRVRWHLTLACVWEPLIVEKNFSSQIKD